jgi:hypothetical protein
MLSVIKDLFAHYVQDASIFSVMHLSFLFYFLYRWKQSWRQIQELLDATRQDPPNNELLRYAEKQIREYAEQGREPNLQKIQDSITNAFERRPESIRPLVNTFVVIGLMGTLFSLFRMGHQLQAITNTQQILERMGIAFSTSFFGIVWALGSSVFLLTPLRRRTSILIQAIDRWLTDISIKYPPRTPERTIEDIAKTLHDNVEAIGTAVDQLKVREEEHLAAAREILAEFRDSTKALLTSLTERITESQDRTEAVARALEGAITSSLQELKNRFIEISQSWRAELNQTIRASEGAAQRLAQASENLTGATENVATSLQAVHDSLERTKDLARIVEAVENLTHSYLEQTDKQITKFKEGIDVSLEVSKQIPNEWFTMLSQRNETLTGQLQAITDGWKQHITQTSEDLFSRFARVGETMEPVIGFLAADGQLKKTLDELALLLAVTKERLEQQASADVSSELSSLKEVMTTLVSNITNLNTAVVPQPEIASPIMHSNGFTNLVNKVDAIYILLDDLLKSERHFVWLPTGVVDPTSSSNEPVPLGADQLSPNLLASMLTELKEIKRKLDPGVFDATREVKKSLSNNESQSRKRTLRIKKYFTRLLRRD